MTDAPKDSANALGALLGQKDRFGKLGEKDFSAATEILVKRLMVSAGQTTEDMKALRETVGPEIFDKVLKSLTAHQARQLARRMDKTVPDIEVSTAGAACAWIRGLMTGNMPAPLETRPTETETTAEETSTEETASDDDKPTPPKNAYFGRKAFRTGG
ncbi:hypothetical protein [Hyphomonas pacifica]|uniref:Uncharacterized protein n=1 Tax=Hyphomonas pacifica TaxID=1280941 RepID=A0A062TVA9_9PROT|nr:hypothetical protein [Hyphomonas pacifica]KCZ46853.1 hypothetical protein HY2_05575 [Hyphomonas pacifica]RAN30470.1 hypothetical protein HY3_06550 [Hyphomonas pacifica]